MYTITGIIEDVGHNCMIHNMNEDKFTYRVVFFINDGNKSAKHYMDTPYSGLRKALENIIKNNLSLTNSIVVAQITVRKNKESVSLLSRSYKFCLDEYFHKICETKEKEYVSNNHGRRKIQWG